MEIQTPQISSSSIEKDFKIAKVLQMQNRTDQAIKKYQQIISTYESITRKEPNSSIDYSITALCIGHLVEIYKNQNELDKASSLLSIQKKFIEHISITKSEQANDDQKENKELGDDKKKSVISLFEQLKETFEKPNMPPKKNPEEVINDYLNEKKKQEKKIAEQNMLRLLRLVEEKKKRLESSRMERWLDWMNSNPIAILIFAMIFLGLFLIFIFAQFKFDENRPNRKNISKKNQQANTKNSKNTEVPNFDTETTKKLTKEELKELSEKLKKIGDEKLQQKLNAHKNEFDAFVNHMKKRYQKNFTKSQEL